MMAREEEIRRIAYGLWEKEGRPQGREMELWLRAEATWESERRKPEGRSQGISSGPIRSAPDTSRGSTDQLKSDSPRGGPASSGNRSRTTENDERT